MVNYSTNINKTNNHLSPKESLNSDDSLSKCFIHRLHCVVYATLSSSMSCDIFIQFSFFRLLLSLCYTIFLYVSWHIYKIFIFSSSVGLDLVTIRALLCCTWSTTTIRPTRQGAWFHGKIRIITSRLSSRSYNWATILIHKQISVLKKQKQLYINN